MATGRFLRGIGRIAQALFIGLGAFMAMQVAAIAWSYGYDAYVLAVSTAIFLGLAWVVGEKP